MSSTKIICFACDNTNSPEATICTHCGTVLSRITSQTNEVTAPLLPSGALLHERYHVLHIIGQGGMSTVYKAEDTKLGQRLVAVKEMTLPNIYTQEELDKVLGAFEREALLLAKLSHPYLPSIYEHFSENGHWYILMQYIRGETLDQCLRVILDRRVAIEDVLNIGIKLCEVLGYLHAQTTPIIFSDLKPSNIMLTPERNLYLIDFGIARRYETTLADDRKFVSQGYSPPEQYQRTQISPRADIYSLGATLHQMLSGLHPSNSGPNFPPLQLGDLLWNKELETLIMSMLKQKEEERPSNIIVVKQSLQHITDLLVQEKNVAVDSLVEGKGAALWDIPLQEDSSGGKTSTTPSSTFDQGSASQKSDSWITQPAPPLEICPVCGANARPSDNYCLNCGQRLLPDDVASTIPVTLENPLATLPPVSTPSLPASIVHSNIRLSLSHITALAWSPNGLYLAAANFEGPILNIYTTLAVRLSHASLFAKKELWKNAVIYSAKMSGTCGMWLRVIEDGKGELTLFYDESASLETRFHFEEYVRVHLQRKALPESINTRHIHRCKCGFVASDQLVRMRMERKLSWFTCPACETWVDLQNHDEQLRSTSSSRISEMDRAADVERARATAKSTIQGKQKTSDFDVFLCYNTTNRDAVISIGEQLKEKGLLPWLDEWELRPGMPWQRQLEKQIQQVKSAAVFVVTGGRDTSFPESICGTRLSGYTCIA
jgi:serine/threonine protein kinase